MASPKRLAACLLAMAASIFVPFAASAQSPADHARVPVLVELFTSEGCSDCPPADRLLEELDTRQPISGAQAIVLSEHVTYWNHQGWRDPFSMDEIDQRQKNYGDQFRIDSIYTPQAVIDGVAQLVGNNAAGVASAIEHAAATPKTALAIANARWDKDAASFSVQVSADKGSRLVAALAADATGAKITAGENSGRTLHHVAVVRAIKDFGSSALDGRTLKLSAGSLAHDQASAAVRLVVFVVDRKGHVVAISEQNLNR